MAEVIYELRRAGLIWVVAALLAAAAGAAVAINVQIAFVLVLLCLALAALAAPTSIWVLSALVAAVTFRGLVQLHVLPGVATFIDLPLSWGALAIGLTRMRAASPYCRQLLGWLAVLTLAIMVSWAFNPSEVLRPVLYLMLLGEPFAIVGALLADPPSPRQRHLLKVVMLALVVIQIPLAALQLVTLGPADHVQGSLYGAGAGAHVISAVILVGAIWILAGGGESRRWGFWRIPVLAALILIPFVADAKQVIAATPAILLASTWRGGRLGTVLRIVLVVAMVIALFTLDPAGKAGLKYIGSASSGQGGKQAAASFVWHKVDGAPAWLIFGRGPAETVSRAAFETVPTEQQKRSPLASLGLKPAVIAAESQAAAQAVSVPGATSVDTGISSTLGVLGDLGIFGIVAYGGLLLSLFTRLRRETSPEGIAAACGFALFLVLGLILDWWEQPPFGVFLGVLAGLSLSASTAPELAEEKDGHQPDAIPAGSRLPLPAETSAEIHGILLSTLSLDEAVAEIGGWVDHGERKYACVANDRALADADHDVEIRSIYNRSGLTLATGLPDSWTDDLGTDPLVGRFRGWDFLLATCALAAERGWPCYLYGGAPGAAERLAQRLKLRFPALLIGGMSAFTDPNDSAVLAAMNASDARIVWLGLPSPTQEHWLASNLHRLGRATPIGLGSAFETYAGVPSTAAPSRSWRRTTQALRDLLPWRRAPLPRTSDPAAPPPASRRRRSWTQR